MRGQRLGYSTLTGFVSLAFIISGLSPVIAQGAVSAKKAQELGKTLTEFGATKAGTSDGMVPAYTGGLKSVPGYSNSDKHYVNPYKNEKPLYTITSKNMGKYAKYLTVGEKALFKRFPKTYKMVVYPSHRSVWYPKWVLNNTKKNATTAKMTGKVKGDAVTGADNGRPYPGVIFPIPKNGYQVMWNHETAYGPAVYSMNPTRAWLVDSAGHASRLPDVYEQFLRPWYDTNKNMRDKLYHSPLGFIAHYVSPPSSSGILFLSYFPLNYDKNGGTKFWAYSPGTRRVRRAPNFAYDTPIAAYGGVLFWSDIFGYAGQMNRFDFKIVGEKEKLIPYNEFKLANSKYKLTNSNNPHRIIGNHFLNPKDVRFEMHRVWIVDATRKPGVRDAYKKRRFYVDEDSWVVAEADGWDDNNKLWRICFVDTFPTYNTGGIDNTMWNIFDLHKNNYTLINVPYGSIHSYTSIKGHHYPITRSQIEGAAE